MNLAGRLFAVPALSLALGTFADARTNGGWNKVHNKTAAVAQGQRNHMVESPRKHVPLLHVLTGANGPKWGKSADSVETGHPKGS